MKKLILSVFLIALYQMMHAQQPSAMSLRILAKAKGDSIVLRWAPMSPGAWQLLNTSGYVIKRKMSGSADNIWTNLTPVPLKPLSLAEMKKQLHRDNKYAAIAAQALYGKTIDTRTKGLAPLTQQNSDILNDRYALALQAADFSAPVAKAIALAYTDKNVTAGQVYIYRVEPADATVKIQAATIIVSNEEQNLQNKPAGLMGFSYDRKAELQWPRNQEQPFSAYEIEISEDNRNFRKLTKDPYYTSMPDTISSSSDSLLQQMTQIIRFNHLYIDSLAKNYQNYYYRIRGIDAFADWSEFSDVVTISGRDLTPPAAVIAAMPQSADKTIQLQWKKTGTEKDLKGFYVYRSSQVDDGYELLTKELLATSTNSYTDNAALPHGPNFYIIAAVDTAGNYSASIPVMGLLPDTTAPAIPAMLKGNIDKDGFVYLNWKSNNEADMKGYKVYYSHQPDQSFQQLTLYPVEEATFTDSITLKTLTKKIYYRVVAVDQHNNHSDYSEILELKKPDIVPPTPPVILNAQLRDRKAVVDFANSASSDAISYTIVRKEASGEWKTISRRAHNANEQGFQFTDSTIRHGISYAYAARVTDEDSLTSALCTPVTLTLRGTEALPAITFTSVVYDAPANKVKLKWNHKSNGDFYYVIYRSLTGGIMERYQTLEKEVKELSDSQVNDIGKGYQYAIQAVYKNYSKATELSAPVSVTR